jgi:hypothetical protein
VSQHLRPIVELWMLWMLRFQRDTMHPLSPYLPRLVLRINSIERRRA